MWKRPLCVMFLVTDLFWTLDWWCLCPSHYWHAAWGYFTFMPLQFNINNSWNRYELTGLGNCIIPMSDSCYWPISFRQNVNVSSMFRQVFIILSLLFKESLKVKESLNWEWNSARHIFWVMMPAQCWSVGHTKTW